MSPSTSPTTEAEQQYYDGMVSARRRLVRPLVIITLVLFFLLQILTNFTPFLDGEIFAGMTWAYVYAFALFFVVVILTTYYRRKMDATEARLRPVAQEQTAGHYEDWNEWEKHEAQLEQEETERERLGESADEPRKETRP